MMMMMIMIIIILIIIMVNMQNKLIQYNFSHQLIHSLEKNLNSRPREDSKFQQTEKLTASSPSANPHS